MWLDQAKIRISSALFAVEAARALRVIDDDHPGPARAALRGYSGRFAAEFKYEDWAQDWRDQLHSSFLHLGRSLQRVLGLRGALARRGGGCCWLHFSPKTRAHLMSSGPWFGPTLHPSRTMPQHCSISISRPTTERSLLRSRRRSRKCELVVHE